MLAQVTCSGLKNYLHHLWLSLSRLGRTRSLWWLLWKGLARKLVPIFTPHTFYWSYRDFSIGKLFQEKHHHCLTRSVRHHQYFHPTVPPVPDFTLWCLRLNYSATSLMYLIVSLIPPSFLILEYLSTEAFPCSPWTCSKKWGWDTWCLSRFFHLVGLLILGSLRHLRSYGG